MSTSQRTEMRQVFYDCFRKYQAQEPLEPVEGQLIEIILMHPEYHAFLTDPEYIDADHFAGENPFFHISLHLALREQIETDRPQGIQDIYLSLRKTCDDGHTVEHRMMDCLAQFLWDAQQANSMPDENAYLAELVKLA